MKRNSIIQTPAAHAPTRSGSLLVEMVVCTVLLSVISVILVPGIKAVQGQRKAVRFESLSMIELNNIAITLNSDDQLDALSLSAWFLHRYPKASVTAETIAEPNDGFRPVRLTLTGSGSSSTTDSVVVWVRSAEAAQ